MQTFTKTDFNEIPAARELALFIQSQHRLGIAEINFVMKTPEKSATFTNWSKAVSVAFPDYMYLKYVFKVSQSESPKSISYLFSFFKPVELHMELISATVFDDPMEHEVDRKMHLPFRDLINENLN